MTRFIQPEELEQIARRVWNARRDQSTTFIDNTKYVRFEYLGYESRDTQFPMLSGQWHAAGPFEVRISYPKWDIPGYVNVRKAVKPGMLSRIEAISLRCPDCEGACEDEKGSQLIENRDCEQIVTCINCRRSCTVPASFFQVRSGQRVEGNTTRNQSNPSPKKKKRCFFCNGEDDVSSFKVYDGTYDIGRDHAGNQVKMGNIKRKNVCSSCFKECPDTSLDNALRLLAMKKQSK